MYRNVTLGLQAVTLSLLLLGLACKASYLGAVVNLEPLDEGGGLKVRAHYTVLAPLPCPSLLQGVCDEEDCITHVMSTPLQGLYPSPGWCVRQWQKTIPNNYTSTLQLGPSVDISMTTRAQMSVRADTDQVNHPPHVALLPPVRVNVDCPRIIPLSVKDLDEDLVKCRYGRADFNECQTCSQHAFLQLDEETCTLFYSGEAAVGQYSVELMVEDFPQALEDHVQALSSISLHLIITVESKPSDCSAVPVISESSPGGGTVTPVLPYDEVNFNVTASSEVESVSEIVVVGPPDLLVSNLTRGTDSQMLIQFNWVRSPNQLPQLLPICFSANTDRSQSDIRCVWLHQRQMDPLPPGTELKCGQRDMSLVLPVSTLERLPLSDLRLNDPTCPVYHNATHVITNFSLTACGTKRVHSGSELVYTNVLRSFRPPSAISRLPSLVLPLACRIKGQEARGPYYRVVMPAEEETFGVVSFWMEFHLPGEGPMGNLTRIPRFRSLQPPRQVREVRAVEKLDMLDLYVMSNASLGRAELIVSRCVESETPDFAQSRPILNQGCATGNSSLEIVTTTPSVRIFRIYLGFMEIKGDLMYVECTMNLCVTTRPSQKCPNQCGNFNSRVLVDSIYTKSYTVRSGPVLLLKTPTVSTTSSTTIATTKAPAVLPAAVTATTQVITTSQAAGQFSIWAAGVMGVSSGLLHMIFLCLHH